MTTAVYLRMSQDREGREYGVERQEAECRNLAARHGIAPESVAVYVDNDISASTRSRKNRPAYASMIDHARAGRVQTILAYSLSRVTRRPREGEDLIELAERDGLQIRTVASGDPDLTRADGRAMFRTLMAWDAAEAERISERVTLQARQRAEHGRNMGGARRLGYSPDGRELVTEEAEAIAWAYVQLLAGASLRSICADWNRRGLVGSKGAAFQPSTVRSVLLRPQNGGLATYHGAILGASLLPAIVSADVWRQACEILNDPARKVALPGRPVAGMLAGLLRCPKCEGPCYTRSGNGSRRIPMYACPLGHITRERDFVDGVVTATLMEFLILNRDALRKPVAATSGDAREEAAALRDRLERLQRLFQAGDLDPEDYAAGAKPLRAALTAAEARTVAEAGCPVTAALVGAEDIPAAWEALDLDGRRTVLRRLLDSVTMLPGPRGKRADDPDLITYQWRE